MKLLLVEDSEKLASLIQNGLEDDGCVVDTISDGEKALARISLYHDDYDVIVLDLGLPSLSGDSVLKKVREKNIHTPILILTARDTVSDKVDLLSAGADDYLTKPFQFEELLARIRALARRPHERKSKTLTYKCLSLDLEAHTAAWKHAHGAHEMIDLSHKEFLLLAYFLQHPTKTITRDELVAHAWDFNDSTRSNVVDAHIKNLRKKLDAHTHEEIITTLRGVGYRLAA